MGFQKSDQIPQLSFNEPNGSLPLLLIGDIEEEYRRAEPLTEVLKQPVPAVADMGGKYRQAGRWDRPAFHCPNDCFMI